MASLVGATWRHETFRSVNGWRVDWLVHGSTDRVRNKPNLDLACLFVETDNDPMDPALLKSLETF